MSKTTYVSEPRFDITINFATKSPLHLKNASIWLNINNEDNWELVTTNLFGSYDDTIIKIMDWDKEVEWYMFLKNTSIFVKADEIIINTFTNFNEFVKAEKTINIEAKLKNISKEIDYYSAKQNFGLVFDQFIKLNTLKNEKYKLKMIKLLNLVLGENYE